MSEKLKNITNTDSVDNSALFYAVDLTRTKGDQDVSITKEDLKTDLGIPTNTIPEAPDDGNQYARQDNAWTVIAPESYQTDDIGSTIPLHTVYGHFCNQQSANNSTSYTINDDDVVGSYALVLINASTEPTITGATQQGGIDFIANTDLQLLVQNRGDAGLIYSFNPVSVGGGEADTLQTVTARGASTNEAITINDDLTITNYFKMRKDVGESQGLSISISTDLNGDFPIQLNPNNVASPGLIVGGSFNFPISFIVNGGSKITATVDAVRIGASASGYELPLLDGTAGQVLTTDGSGQVTFEDVAGGYNITADDITIPSTIYACVGFETNIYYDALVPCFDNGLATKTNVEIICAKGQSFQDRWALTATSPDVGTETMTINVYDDNNNLIAAKSVSLNIVEDSGNSISANILMVGDSLTFAGTITSTLRTSLLTFTGITPTFYGSQGTSPNNQEGRAGWAFSSFVGATSPFYNGGVIDIANYRSSVLSSAPVFDIVTIQLGVNDSFDNDVKTDAEITAILDDAKTLIDAFIADNSDSKIIVQLPTLCANTLDGWADDYDATRKRNNYKENIFLLRKAILNDFDLGAYNSNVSVGQAGLSVDRYYGYPRSSGNPATRLTGDTVERHTNALHPTEGYPQIADGILGQVLNFIEESGTSLGPELIINGDFSASPMSYANGWYSIDSDVRIENNELWMEDLSPTCRAYATNGTNLDVLTQTKSYRLEYTISENNNNAQLECYYDGVYNEVPDIVGTHVVTFTQNSTSKLLIFLNTANTSGDIIKIDNVSLKEIL